MDKKMRESVLSIFYTDQNKKLHHETQGKYFHWNGKPVYLADFESPKPFKNFDGFPIAKQILEAFSQVRIRVTIAYRVRKLGTIYFAKPSDFRKHGWKIPYGGHEQYILGSSFWKSTQTTLNDPHTLPVMAVDDWMKSASISPAQKPLVEDFTIPLGVKMRLGEEFRRKYA